MAGGLANTIAGGDGAGGAEGKAGGGAGGLGSTEYANGAAGDEALRHCECEVCNAW